MRTADGRKSLRYPWSTHSDEIISIGQHIAGDLETRFLITRNFYDSQGRKLFSTSAAPEGADIDKIIGTRFIYDVNGRTIGTESRRGIVIAITLTERGPLSTLISEGVVIDETRSEFDRQGRLVRSWDSFGTVTEYFYDRWQQVIESRTLAIDTTGRKYGEFREMSMIHMVARFLQQTRT